MFFIGSAGSRCERRGPVPNQPCPGCGRRGMELIETYFGLSAFFLPLARLDRRYYLVCPACAGVWEISRADGKLLQQHPEAVLPADHLAAAGGELALLPQLGNPATGGAIQINAYGAEGLLWQASFDNGWMTVQIPGGEKGLVFDSEAAWDAGLAAIDGLLSGL